MLMGHFFFHKMEKHHHNKKMLQPPGYDLTKLKCQKCQRYELAKTSVSQLARLEAPTCPSVSTNPESDMALSNGGTLHHKLMQSQLAANLII